MDTAYFDYSLQPGRNLIKREYTKQEPLISLIVPFYNDKKYIKQAIYSFLNQTFPLFEILIIDDGSQDKESLVILEEIEEIDERIKVFHKENEGPATARDYGVSKSSKTVEYITFCDADDLLEPTFLECAYWTLETNPGASWAFTDSTGFGTQEYLWNSWFDSERLKKSNNLVITSVVRKKDFLLVNGFGIKEKAINEDWNFWLKLIAQSKYPVRMNFYGNWYRRKKQGELESSKRNVARTLEIIHQTVKTIKKPVEAIQYPKQDYNWDGIVEIVPSICISDFKKQDKITILMIIPWMVTGGADKFNLDLVKGLDKDKFEVIIVTTEPSVNTLRQQFEQYATVYDLTTFINQKYWIAFICYLIEVRKVDIIFNTNSKIGYSMLPYLKASYPNIPILDYIHMEEWYNRNGGYSRDSSTISSIIDKTLVCNANSEKILVDYFNRDPKEVKTVYIGVSPEEFDPEKIEKEKIYEKYQIPKGKYIISYICRIVDQKRPYLLLEIVKRLKQERNDFIVLIVGEGNMLKEIKQHAKQKALMDSLLFLGNVKETKEIYAISDMTLNCSLKEGLALTTYESLAMGVPVVSSDVGGQRELINEKVGVIVPCLQEETQIHDFNYKEEEIIPYVKGINKILKNLPMYQKNGRKRILEGFTIEQMVKEMERIFQDTVLHPNLQKRQNGTQLVGSIDITKELINMNFMTNAKEYEWLCVLYNRTYYSDYHKHSVLKERLWTFPLWRLFIRFLQKTGIMKQIKRLMKRG